MEANEEGPGTFVGNLLESAIFVLNISRFIQSESLVSLAYEVI